MATKAASKKVVSKTPLLDAAVIENPHKQGNGWDKEAARSLALEFAKQITSDMPTEDFLKLMEKYKDYAGWKNLAKAAAAKFGVISAKEFAQG